MRIEHLSIKNFRNYVQAELDFKEGVNLIFGDNAQGKTNLLEAIYMAATTRSFRGGKDREMIRWEQQSGHIAVTIRKDGISHKIDMHLETGKRKAAAIDGLPIRKSGELLGLLHTVAFSPDDLDMIKEGPDRRRRFLDMELCQLDKLYLSRLSEYNKALAQRNALLKQLGTDKELISTLDIWDRELSKAAEYVIRERTRFVEELAPILGEKHAVLTKGKETLSISYEPNISAEEMFDRLKKTRERDCFLKTTGTGPHRDDIQFRIGNMDVRTYGSQGQQRTVVLALKLSEIELVKKKIQDLPILLLDDVLSELDRNRQLQLLGEMKDVQTIVTCTGMEELIRERNGQNRIFLVKEGNVKEIKEDIHESGL